MTGESVAAHVDELCGVRVNCQTCFTLKYHMNLLFQMCEVSIYKTSYKLSFDYVVGKLNSLTSEIAIFDILESIAIFEFHRPLVQLEIVSAGHR